jgi:hypothetical protein
MQFMVLSVFNLCFIRGSKKKLSRDLITLAEFYS